MLFPNVQRILKTCSPSSSIKLIFAVAASSRPKYKNFFLGLLQPFVRQGQIFIRYRCYERNFETGLRMSDLDADFLSTKELSLDDVYYLERQFRPDMILDGGGNIGLFTLRAVAAMQKDGWKSMQVVICEPLPRNVEQIKRHLAMNNVDAEILPYCLGGERRTIPFYCRGANQSSFNSTEAYDSVIEIPVVLLEDVVALHPAERLLIKLDIEGMEIEVLDAYVPGERRAVYMVGELHDVQKNSVKMEQIFKKNGWAYELVDADIETSGFRACSPAAMPLLHWPAVKPEMAPA
jgi:FkbM family methyltransferase